MQGISHVERRDTGSASVGSRSVGFAVKDEKALTGDIKVPARISQDDCKHEYQVKHTVSARSATRD